MKANGIRQKSSFMPIACGASLVEQLEPRQMLDAAWPEGYETAFEDGGRGASCTVDLDNDGDLDLAVWQRRRLTIALNDGQGNYSADHEVPIAGRPGMLAAGDFNGDGFDDVLTLGRFGARSMLRVFGNDQAGSLERLSRQRTNADWVGVFDGSSLLATDDFVLRRPGRLWLGRLDDERVRPVRTLIVSFGEITVPAVVDFEGDGHDDALLVGVNDRGMAQLLEVRPALTGEPARVVFSQIRGSVGSVVVRRASDADASGPGVAFSLMTFDTELEFRVRVMAMELPDAAGMEYAEPDELFSEAGHYAAAHYEPSHQVFLELVAIGDIDDDGENEVITSYFSYNAHGSGGDSDQQTSLLVLDRAPDEMWGATARDAEAGYPEWTYAVEDFDGDGLPDLIRSRAGGAGRSFRIEIAFNQMLP